MDIDKQFQADVHILAEGARAHEVFKERVRLAIFFAGLIIAFWRLFSWIRSTGSIFNKKHFTLAPLTYSEKVGYINLNKTHWWYILTLINYGFVYWFCIHAPLMLVQVLIVQAFVHSHATVIAGFFFAHIMTTLEMRTKTQELDLLRQVAWHERGLVQPAGDREAMLLGFESKREWVKFAFSDCIVDLPVKGEGYESVLEWCKANNPTYTKKLLAAKAHKIYDLPKRYSVDLN